MNKKIFVAVFLAGVLVLTGAGCGIKNFVKVQKQTNANPANADQTSASSVSADLMNADSTKFCDSAAVTEAPNAQAKELKLIFDEAGGEMEFIINIPKDSQIGDTFVYILKNKPTTKKLENAFKKHGYKIEMSGSVMVVSKNKLYFSIGFTDKEKCQEVVIMTSDKPFNLGGAVTTEECKIMWEIASHADLRYNRLDVSWVNTIKLYHYWYMLAAKYGVTKEIIAKTCKAELGPVN